ncbi:hypothetical protein BH09PSE3_BH09PSE3_07440 [soil metagenome]
MEDILSSIKRIIAEDSDAALSAPRGKRSVGGLTQAAAPAPVVPEADDSEILELTEAVPADEPATEQPVTQPVAAKTPEPEAQAKSPLLSQATLNASRSSIAALSALIVKPEVTGGDTLEGLVREMLKPMLADWLDQRLPDVVERLVAQEIARITARG